MGRDRDRAQSKILPSPNHWCLSFLLVNCMHRNTDWTRYCRTLHILQTPLHIRGACRSQFALCLQCTAHTASMSGWNLEALMSSNAPNSDKQRMNGWTTRCKLIVNRRCIIQTALMMTVQCTGYFNHVTSSDNYVFTQMHTLFAKWLNTVDKILPNTSVNYSFFSRTTFSGVNEL